MRLQVVLSLIVVFAVPAVFADSKDKELMEKEALVTLSEQKAIDALSRIIKKRQGTEEEAELWERMSELYLKQAKSARFFQLTKTSENTMSFLPPVIREKTSLRPLQKAIECFNTIEKRFPKYEDMDRILFHSSLTLAQMGMFAQSTQQIEKLLNKFSKSEMLPDGQLLYGEILYDQKKFGSALVHFEKASASKKEKVSQYAQYKAAWSQYNLRNNEDAIQKLKTLVKALDPQLAEGFALRNESLRDLAIFMTETRDFTEAFAFFSAFATEKETSDTLLKMAQIYRAHSRHKEAVGLGNLFLDKGKHEAGKIQFNMFFADYYRDMKNGKMNIEHLKKVQDLCAISPAEAVETCDKELRVQISQTAELWWKEWDRYKTAAAKDPKGNYGPKAKENLEFARQALELEIKRNPTPRAQTLEAYADLLYQANDFELSSRVYKDLHDRLVKENEKDKAKLEKLSYASLVSLDRWMELDKKKILPQEFFKLQVDAYLKSYPQTAHRNELLLKWATLEFSEANYAGSEKKLREILANKPVADLVVPVQNQLLESLKNQKKTSEMQTLLNEWSQHAKTPARKTELMRSQAQLQLEDMETATAANKDAVATLKEYNAFLKKFEGDEKITEPVQWKALGLALVSQQDEQVLTMIEKLGQPVTNKKAAKVDPRIWDSLKQLLLREQKSVAVRQKVFDLSLKHCPDKDRGSLLWSYRDFQLKLNRIGEAMKTEDEIVKIGLEPERSLILVGRLEKDLDAGKVKKVYEESKKYTSKNNTDIVRARARILQARILEGEFKEARLKSSLSALQTVLSIKLERLSKAQEAYVSATKMSSDSVVVQFAREGLKRCFEHAIDALKRLEVKDQLSAEEKQVLDAQIKEIVAPLESKLKELNVQKQAEAKI